MSEKSGYSLEKWLENANALWGKIQLSHIPDNLCLEDECQIGPCKVKSFCFENSFCHLMPSNTH